MFSLHKNFIQEQQKLINQLQDQVVENNIQKTNIGKELAKNEKLMGYIKKITQILSYYYPKEHMATNLLVSILNCHEVEKCDEPYSKDIEEKIQTWENSLIQKKESEKNAEDTKVKTSEEPETKKVPNIAPSKETSPAKKKVVKNFGGLLLVEEE